MASRSSESEPSSRRPANYHLAEVAEARSKFASTCSAIVIWPRPATATGFLAAAADLSLATAVGLRRKKLFLFGGHHSGAVRPRLALPRWMRRPSTEICSQFLQALRRARHCCSPSALHFHYSESSCCRRSHRSLFPLLRRLLNCCSSGSAGWCSLLGLGPPAGAVLSSILFACWRA